MLSFSRTSRLNRAILLTLLAVVPATGCSSARKKNTVEVPTDQTTQPTEQMGPFPLPGGGSGSEVFGPASPPEKEPRQPTGKIVISFGPGMVTGFAASGVLRKLEELNVPVSRIYAHEGAALVSAIHSANPNSNRVDWALMKLNDAPIVRSQSGFALSGPEAKLETRLKEIFGNRELSSLRPPVMIPLYFESANDMDFSAMNRQVAEVLRLALSGDELGLRPKEVDGRKVTGRGSSVIEFMKAVDSREEDPVLFVSFAPLSAEEAAFLEGIRASTLQVNLREVSETDFKKRNLAVFRGKEAVERQKSEIYRLIGRDETAQKSGSPGL